MKPSSRKGGGSAPKTRKVMKEPTKVIITNPDSPFCGKKATVRRVRYAAHVDLLVTLAGDQKITVDSTWTDYWIRKGEPSPPALLMASPDQVRKLRGMLGRLERQVEGASGDAIAGKNAVAEVDGNEVTAD